MVATSEISLSDSSAAAAVPAASASTSLQLAIDVNAQISAVLVQRDEAAFERLEQARETLGDLIDNLEAEFMKSACSSSYIKACT